MEIGVEVFPYTLEEVRDARAQGWGVVRPALEEGELLAGVASLADLLDS